MFHGYRGQFHLHGGEDIADVEWQFLEEPVPRGESVSCHVWFARPDRHLRRIQVGDDFEIREADRVVGRGTITALLVDGAC